MRGSSGQRLVVLLLVVLAAMFVAGCGGDGESTTSSTRTGVATSNPSEGADTTADLVGRQIIPSADSPSSFVEVFQTRPLVLFFFVPGGRDDTLVWDSLQSLQPSFDTYAFFYYDYSEPEEYGDLSTMLAVDYTPLVVLIDRTGFIQKVWSGFVDEGSLNQSLVNLGRD